VHLLNIASVYNLFYHSYYHYQRLEMKSVCPDIRESFLCFVRLSWYWVWSAYVGQQNCYNPRCGFWWNVRATLRAPVLKGITRARNFKGRCVTRFVCLTSEYEQMALSICMRTYIGIILCDSESVYVTAAGSRRGSRRSQSQWCQ
jgi:hypothetical protein